MASETTPTVHVDEQTGQDTPQTAGSTSAPFKTLTYAYIQFPQQDGTPQYLIRKAGDEPTEPAAADAAAQSPWKPAAKAAMKKAVNAYEAHKKKEAKSKDLAAQKEKDEAERQVALEKAKDIKISEDPTLPKAVKIKLNEQDPNTVRLRSGDSKATGAAATGDKDKDVDYTSADGGRGTRVRVFGRVHRERKQKDVMFVTLRDGYGTMQCVLTGPLAKTYDAVTLTRETSMEITGEMWQVPPGAHAPLDRELHADFFRIVPGGRAAGGDDAITNRVAEKGDPQTLLDLRHLTLRGDKASSVMLVRDAVEFAFHQTYRETHCRKVSPPALVQTQVEGGSTLFKFDYYGETAFLTQSSQLYLETCLPALGDVYCVEKSFRAEKSLTRRHLSEYTHIEAELDFITFDDLLESLEHVMCRVISLVLADPAIARAIHELNPGFTPPTRPFKRMRYSDAIDWLHARGVKNEEGNDHVFGDDIAEAAERKMTDEIGRPIFLTHFPVAIKAFYMQKDGDDRRVTESVDCLMPGVGEIVGGSMRMWDREELLAAYEREGIDAREYYWYTDQRKYGTSPHGGYGLGLERFLAWLCNLHTVREACLYPRYMGRCKP